MKLFMFLNPPALVLMFEIFELKPSSMALVRKVEK